jgi:hypothetical protein
MPASDNSAEGKEEGNNSGGSGGDGDSDRQRTQQHQKQSQPQKPFAAKLLTDGKIPITTSGKSSRATLFAHTGKHPPPLVVIPKRRKHKNYISRRKGGGRAAAALRKCASDPQLHRGYNHWAALMCANEEEEKVGEEESKSSRAQGQEQQKGPQKPSVVGPPAVPRKKSSTNRQSSDIGGTDPDSMFRHRIQELDAATAKLLAVAKTAQEDEKRMMAASASERLDALGKTTAPPTPNPPQRLHQQQTQLDSKVEELKSRLEEIMPTTQPQKKTSGAGLAGAKPATPKVMTNWLPFVPSLCDFIEFFEIDQMRRIMTFLTIFFILFALCSCQSFWIQFQSSLYLVICLFDLGICILQIEE